MVYNVIGNNQTEIMLRKREKSITALVWKLPDTESTFCLLLPTLLYIYTFRSYIWLVVYFFLPYNCFHLLLIYNLLKKGKVLI